MVKTKIFWLILVLFPLTVCSREKLANDNYSILILSLEKSMITIERYQINKLSGNYRRVSRKERLGHVVGLINLSQRGLSIRSIESTGKKGYIKITTQRGTKKHEYDLEPIFLKDKTMIDAIERVPLEITRRRDHEQRRFLSTIQLNLNDPVSIELDGIIKSACAFLVPNEAIESREMPKVILRANALDKGILKLIKEESTDRHEEEEHTCHDEYAHDHCHTEPYPCDCYAHDHVETCTDKPDQGWESYIWFHFFIRPFVFFFQFMNSWFGR